MTSGALPQGFTDELSNRHNPDGLRVIHRVIASLIVISSDGKVLMGRKDPQKGGVYSHAWHIPGGGVEEGETLEEAARREGMQEVEGLILVDQELVQLPFVGRGEAYKTLGTGEKVWCVMEFNRFEVRLFQAAAELELALRPGDDIVELRWFGSEELAHIEHIPGGKEFFIQAGYIKSDSE